MNAAEHANVAQLTLFKATQNSCPIFVLQRHYSYTAGMDGWTDG